MEISLPVEEEQVDRKELEVFPAPAAVVDAEVMDAEVVDAEVMDVVMDEVVDVDCEDQAVGEDEGKTA